MIYVPYVKEQEARRLVNFDSCGNISKTGSVVGMRKLYGWEVGGQVRLRGWIYNIGPTAVETLRKARLVRG